METTIEKIAWIITWGRVVRKGIQTGEDPLPALKKLISIAEELYCDEHKRHPTSTPTRPDDAETNRDNTILDKFLKHAKSLKW